MYLPSRIHTHDIGNVRFQYFKTRLFIEYSKTCLLVTDHVMS